jgi:hypothetical protein
MQMALEDQGYQLPKYGADGDFGAETREALRAFAKDEDLNWSDGPVTHVVLDVLFAGRGAGWDAADDPIGPPVITTERVCDNVEIIDLRDEPFSERIARKYKRAGGMPVVRDVSQVTGITIHQTAVKYSVRDYQIHAAGGDRKMALARRALKVACHAMSFHDGFVVWTNPLDWYVYHGNGFNAFELGIEIDGNYPGLIDGKTWNKKTATTCTEKSIEAARAGIELLVREGRKMGMPIEYIHAHRQSSATRRSDPGEELWNRVVLEFAVPLLGLQIEPSRVLRNGRPIPREWDPTGIGAY